MKTTCYCIYCPHHPLFEKRHDIKFPTGFFVGEFIREGYEAGVEVDCLQPDSPAFSELNIDPDDYEFPKTAYGDGSSQTGFSGHGFEIQAYCDNEEYVD